MPPFVPRRHEKAAFGGAFQAVVGLKVSFFGSPNAGQISDRFSVRHNGLLPILIEAAKTRRDKSVCCPFATGFGKGSHRPANLPATGPFGGIQAADGPVGFAFKKHRT